MPHKVGGGAVSLMLICAVVLHNDSQSWKLWKTIQLLLLVKENCSFWGIFILN